LGQLLSTYDTSIAINDSVICEAESNVPKSGYDVTPFFVKPLTPEGLISDDDQPLSPDATVKGYLTADSQAPNGFPVSSGITFPDSPSTGDFALRTDYLPHRLFRFDGKRWVKIEDVQRTGLTQGAGNQTQLGTFVNNTNTYVDYKGDTHNEKQSLSKALTPKADN
jgi:hypothetical protein